MPPTDLLDQLETDEDTQLTIALRRILDEAQSVDPRSTCARFNSAF